MTLANPAEYWSRRLARYGHTGDTNPIVYGYDQPQRVTAIESALARIGRPPASFRHACDVGCGTGDFSHFLLERGVPRVTALDCAPAVVEFVANRFESYADRFTAQCTPVQDATCSDEAFDLTVSVDALQHVLDPVLFDKAVANICRMASTGGTLVICDHTTAAPIDRQPNSYVVVRSKSSYVEAFLRHGCELRGAFGMPRIGVRICQLLTWIGGKALGTYPPDAGPAQELDAPAFARGLQRSVYRAVLASTRALDRHLFPFPPAWTDMVILVFQKVRS